MQESSHLHYINATALNMPHAITYEISTFRAQSQVRVSQVSLKVLKVALVACVH